MIWARSKFVALTVEEGALSGFALAAVTVVGISVLDDRWLHLYCFLGAVCGGYAKIMSKPPGLSTQQRTIQQYAAELLASFVYGIALAPMLIENTGMPVTKASALGVAFGMAYFGNLILHAFSPLVEAHAPRFFEYLFGWLIKRWTGDSTILKSASQHQPPPPPSPPSQGSIFDSDKHP